MSRGLPKLAFAISPASASTSIITRQLHLSTSCVRPHPSSFTPSFSFSNPNTNVTLLMSMSTLTSTSAVKSRLNESAKLTLLYDGECPLCVREIDMLRARSQRYHNSLGFVDIAADDFEDDQYGVNYETAMGTIHAVLPNGSLINGVKVFQLAYDAVGLGWVYAIIKIKPLLWLADKVYAVWADNRLSLTGRDTLEAIIRARNEKRSCR